MPSVPSQAAEAIVAILLPPACREEVLGDLYQRYRSPRQYFFDALSTIPLVILSRIRRTADPQLVVMQALALYLAFAGAAWFRDRALLSQEWGIPRLAYPPAVVLLGLTLHDAYRKPGVRSSWSMALGPCFGLGLAVLSQAILRSRHPQAALPIGIMVYGCAASLLLSSAIRLLFPPGSRQLQGVNVPAHWLKRAGDPLEIPRGLMRMGKVVLVLGVVLIAVELWIRR